MERISVFQARGLPTVGMSLDLQIKIHVKIRK